MARSTREWRWIREDGAEISFPDQSAFLTAILDGTIASDDLVSASLNAPWVKASGVTAHLQQAMDQEFSDQRQVCPELQEDDDPALATEHKTEERQEAAPASVDSVLGNNDKGEGRHDFPTHSWIGKLLVTIYYFVGSVSLLVMIASMFSAGFEAGELLMVVVPATLLLGVGPILLARGLQRFRPWAWWVIMLIHGAGIGLSLVTLPMQRTEAAPATFFAIIISLVIIGYLYENRTAFRGPGGI